MPAVVPDDYWKLLLLIALAAGTGYSFYRVLLGQ